MHPSTEARQLEHLLAASRLRFDLDSILEEGKREKREGGGASDARRNFKHSTLPSF